MKFDWQLFVPAVLLCTLGLTIIGSVSPHLFPLQLIFFLVSFILFLLLNWVGHKAVFSFYLPLYLLSQLFLLLPLFFGVSSRGASRWLQIDRFHLQPSEIVKPFLLVFFAVLAAKRSSLSLVALAASFLPPFLLIFFQPDLGTALVVLTGWLTAISSRLRLKTLLGLCLAGLVLLYPLYRIGLKDYQRQRLLSYLNPYSDPLGEGYHVIQSLISVGSGGLIGRGLGHGPQSQLRFLPEHHTDFIFASLSEELGFLGSVTTLALIAFLLWRIYKISQTTKQYSQSVFCLSALALLAFQIFANIAMNLGLAPVAGITLPFLSYGGSSLLSVFITLALVNSISTSQTPRLPI